VTLGVKLVTQLMNRGLNAKRVEQWDRYLVTYNVFLVVDVIRAQGRTYKIRDIYLREIPLEGGFLSP